MSLLLSLLESGPTFSEAKPGPSRENPGEGKAWCVGCNKPHPIARFDLGGNGGLLSSCRARIKIKQNWNKKRRGKNTGCPKEKRVDLHYKRKPG